MPANETPYARRRQDVPSLFVIQGRDRGLRIELDGPLTGLGRDAANAIRLQDTEVSRRHAEIRRTENGSELVDLNSSNGTFVNGERVQQHALSSGDQIQLGRTLLLYTGGDLSSPPLDDSVFIVTSADPGDSRIVRSMPQSETSDFFQPQATGSESPWLARARSNLQVMYRTALAVSHTLDIDELLNRIM